jgi:transposase
VDGHGGWLYRRATNQPSSNSDARVCRPERRQSEWQDYCLDETLPQDDVARTVLAYVSLLDLSVLYESIEISDHQAGPPAIAPEVLTALWLMATIEGIGSARQLDRVCERDARYRWICGGVSVNYHTLCDFRSLHVEFLGKLLVDSVSALIHQGVVPLETVAQDGMRVRASAGKCSVFGSRRRES